MMRAFHSFICVMLVCLFALTPRVAMAWDSMPVEHSPKSSNVLAIDNCIAQNKEKYGIDDAERISQLEQDGKFTAYTTKVVSCLRNATIGAVDKLLIGLSDFMVPVVAGMLTLAIATFGIQVLGGQRPLGAHSIRFMIRLALVSAFSYALGGLTPYIFAAMDELTAIASGGFSPWIQIDQMIGKLIGNAPGIMLFQGFLGIIGASLFSSTVGMSLGLVGIMAILNLLWFVFTMLFTYLSAYVIVGFLLVLSPLIIPLAIFGYTERYFKKWVDILLVAILTPVLLFAFLSQFIWIFGDLIANVFGTLGFTCSAPHDLTSCLPADFSSFWKISQPLYSWTMPTDTNYLHGANNMADIYHKGVAPVQSFVNPFQHEGVDSNWFHFSAIDFGPDNVGITQRLVYIFIELWIFASLMKSMILKIPQIASDIVGVMNPVRIMSESPTEMIGNRLNTIKNDVKFLKMGAGLTVANRLIGKLRK